MVFIEAARRRGERPGPGHQERPLMPDAAYTCGRCKNRLPAEAFGYPKPKNGHYCRACAREYNKERRIARTGGRKCQQCGESLEDKGLPSAAKFCDAECRAAWHDRSHYRCGKCGLTLSRLAFAPSQRRDGCYCRECAFEHAQDRRRQSGKDIFCGACGRPLDDKGHNGMRRYCNDECQNEARLRRRSDKPRRPAHPQLYEPGWLENAYLVEWKSVRDIAAEVECSRCAVKSAMKAMGVDARRIFVNVCEWCGEEWETNRPARAHNAQCYSRLTTCKRYGMTAADYHAMYRSQGGRCAICRKEECSSGRHFAIDHDHSAEPPPGQICRKEDVRGLLCGNCNHGIGMLQDDLEFLRAAIAYLGGQLL